MELSVVLPSYNEAGNIGPLIANIRHIVENLGLKHEILVIDGHSQDSTLREAVQAGAEVYVQQSKGYGGAILEGFKLAQGNYILTMDADLSHNPLFIQDMWRKKETADIIIASRYVKGGRADMPFSRTILSKLLNWFFAKALSMPIKDLSSGFRMYHKEVAKESLTLKGSDFNILQEIIIQAYNNGWRIKEVPFHYKQRKYGRSKAKLAKFAFSYIRTLRKMWSIRNSVQAADYDDRAFYSRILPQRLWQRWRFRILMDYAKPFITNNPTDKKAGIRVIDLGCGSQKAIQHMPQAIGLDILFKKLRFLKKTNRYRIQGSMTDLPLKNEQFDCVISSEVIEHIPVKARLFQEMNRILKKKGTLIIGTPDYGRLSWRVIEWCYGKVLPGAYADEHCSPYTNKSLRKILADHGFKVLSQRYVFGSEVIMKAVKA